MAHTAKVFLQQVIIDSGEVALEGDLARPEGTRGLVLFAHGSGSSRASPRNRAVATTLNQAGLATLLFDLLTPQEQREDQLTAALRFDIDLLSHRLAGALDWVHRSPDTKAWKLGLFGASTGAAAALVVAATRPDTVAALVSRGGRADLAGDALPRVKAPTLLIVGGEDHQVLALNRQAAGTMSVTPRLEIVSGATHLFEEPGAMEQVTRLARDWFVAHLCA